MDWWIDRSVDRSIESGPFCVQVGNSTSRPSLPSFVVILCYLIYAEMLKSKKQDINIYQWNCSLRPTLYDRCTSIIWQSSVTSEVGDISDQWSVVVGDWLAVFCCVFVNVVNGFIVRSQVYVKINKDAETNETVHESAKLYFNRMEQGLQCTHTS